MDEKIRKFIAFEWLMLMIVGFFWGAAMFLPLFLSRSLADPAAFGKNFLIIAGPYCAYFFCRLGYLYYRSLRWAWLVSDMFYSSEGERVFAQEWIYSALFFTLWSLVLAYPLYITDMFLPLNLPWAILIMAAPYGAFSAARFLLKCTLWAFRALKK